MLEFNPDDLMVNMSKLNDTDCGLFAETAAEMRHNQSRRFLEEESKVLPYTNNILEMTEIERSYPKIPTIEELKREEEQAAEYNGHV